MAGAKVRDKAVIEHIPHPIEAVHGCRYCWMCRHVCPVGHVTHRETHTPHAWALMIDAQSKGTLTWNDDSTNELYACADCGMCRTHCVTDQPLPDAIAEARASVAKSGAAPKSVYTLHEKLQKWGNPYQEGAASKPAKGEVGLFIGDAAAYLGPKVWEAAIKLLEAAGLKPVPVGVGRSNGLLASSLGFPDTATAHAKAVLADVAASGCRELLVLAPGDRYAFERLYRERLNIEWPAAVAVKEVTAVLAEAAAAGRLEFRNTTDAPAYTYHDPCHGPRAGHNHAAPRALLAAALGAGPAVDMFWREQRAHPCGAIGGLEFTQPAIAARLADARLADAASRGAKWVIADDPGCLNHLRGRNSAAPGQGGLEVRGLYELLVEQLQH
jgi:Fe-S oxidoreductase